MTLANIAQLYFVNMSLLSIYLFVSLFTYLQSLFFLVENVKQQEIRESDLMKIGNEITKQRCRLGRVLGVEDGELEQIKEDYPEKSLEQSFRILKRWMEIKGSDATYTALAKALLDRTVALKSVLEKFCLEK